MRFPTIRLAAMLILVTPALAGAQGVFGVKGGLSFGDVSNKGVLPGNLDGRSGFAAGVALSAPGSIIGLGVEGLYAQRGLDDAGGTNGFRLDYIDVPLYLTVTIPTPGVRPFGYLGPQVSFEVACKTGTGDCADGTRKKTTYAGVIGAGIRFGPASGFSIEGRYVYGLSDLDLGTITSSESYKSRSFLILGAIWF